MTPAMAAAAAAAIAAAVQAAAAGATGGILAAASAAEQVGHKLPKHHLNLPETPGKPPKPPHNMPKHPPKLPKTPLLTGGGEDGDGTELEPDGMAHLEAYVGPLLFGRDRRHWRSTCLHARTLTHTHSHSLTLPQTPSNSLTLTLTHISNSRATRCSW